MRNVAICTLFLFSVGSNGARNLSGRSSIAQPLHPTAAVEIFVDGSSGLDTNPGTSAKPVKTISRGASIASANHRNNIATTVTINPGTYREFVQISGVNPNVGAPVTFQASKIGSVIISGSDVWTDWRADSAAPGSFVRSWPYAWGTCSVPAGWPSLKEIVLRREMVFVNGKLLVQVLSPDQLREGTFYIDDATKLVHIWPERVSDIAKAVVEVGVRPQLFESYQVPHLTVRGIVFQYANSCISTPQRSAVAIVGATDQLLEDSTIRWNNWTGLTLFNVTKSSARRMAVNNNGELGIDGFRIKDLTMEDVEASSNNWRGAWGQFLTWETGGAKFLFVHGGTFRNYKAVSNQGRGIWFDTDNADITLDQAYLAHNMVNGILLEANMGPFTITNSRICGNNQGGVVTNQSQSVA
ncbi:MAG: right-handed parallel beta-helix repeat-containing protein, partial [Candidatus Acidiferrales bacterium]